MKQRYLSESIAADLKSKMVFLGGPRQVGKTTIAKDIIGSGQKSQYYTWDKIDQRRRALKGEWDPESSLVLLDEFHKYTKWKTWIKGEYDTHKGRHQFLLTGSARLNVFRRGGDSLQGRYHYYRLHPFSLAEVLKKKNKISPGKELVFQNYHAEDASAVETLLRFGGFPEPFLAQDERSWRRWINERHERFLKEDVRDLTRIQDIGNFSLLTELLPQRVSSILSINSLSQDLQVNFRTASLWLDVLENFYYSYRLSPYASKKIAAVKKEKKLFLWDWSEIENEAARFENMIGSHLLKLCHYLQDTEGWKTELYYLRDHHGREVDFMICQNQKPWFAVEVKLNDESISPHLTYFREKLSIPYVYQIVKKGNVNVFKNSVHLMSADRFLNALV